MQTKASKTSFFFEPPTGSHLSDVIPWYSDPALVWPKGTPPPDPPTESAVTPTALQGKPEIAQASPCEDRQNGVTSENLLALRSK